MVVRDIEGIGMLTAPSSIVSVHEHESMPKDR